MVREFELHVWLCADGLEPGACFGFWVSLALPLPHSCSVSVSASQKYRGAWVAQLVKRTTSAQVMISQFVSSSPVLGSVLTAQSLEPASDSVSPSLSAPSPLTALSLSVSEN